MRTSLIPLMATVLLLVAGSVAAEPTGQVDGRQTMYEPRNPLLESRGNAPLTLSPLILEIQRINEESATTQRELLAELAATHDEQSVLRLVSRLERLETERQVAIFKVRILHARQVGRYDLAFELRHQMVLLLQRNPTSLM